MKVEQELLILGLLKDKPRHGYEIKKQIKDVISPFAPLEVESIYYSLVLLKKRGLVQSVKSSQGNRPEKFVYSLTPRGQERLNDLLKESILRVDKPNFQIDIALYFLPYLPREEALRSLKVRERMLARVKMNLQRLAEELRKKPSYHLISIVDHNLELLEAEKRFISHAREELSR